MRTSARIERPAGQAPGRPIKRWLIDLALVLVVAGPSVPGLAGPSGRVTSWAVILLVLQLAPLMLRRRWPVPVFCWVLVVAVFGALVGGPGLVAHSEGRLVPGVAVFVALYTVAAAGKRRSAFAFAWLLLAAEVAATAAADGREWWYDALFIAGLVAGAVGLGLYVATRRAYLAELRDRAERAERERDQQVALAEAAERARIAREMHDIVAHHLTVMVSLSDGAAAAAAVSPERALQVMRTVSETGRRALADTRGVLGILRGRPDSARGVKEPGPSAVDSTSTVPDGAGLRPVPDLGQVDLLVSQVRAAGMPTTLEVHGGLTGLPAEIQTAAYRVIQEALTNALKHGGPGTRATVRLSCGPFQLEVRVDDDGAGATAAVPAGVGNGLVGMQERVHAYGGELTAAPRGSTGWRVRALLPVPGPALSSTPHGSPGSGG